MGSHCKADLAPEHVVQLSRGFEISATEVTQGAFSSLMGYNPSSFPQCGAECPVETVSWHQAAAYCNALSRAAGLIPCYRCEGSDAAPVCALDAPYVLQRQAYTCPGYRLPTEAEWERAARGPDDAATAEECAAAPGFDDAAWFADNAGEQPHAVGQKAANGWGLFDTSGNVAEWTNDWYGDLHDVDAVDPSGTSFSHSKVVRGGSFQSRVDGLPGWSRSQAAAEAQTPFIGFRCARGLGSP